MDWGQVASIVFGAVLAAAGGAGTAILGYQLEKKRRKSERKQERRERRFERVTELLLTLGRIARVSESMCTQNLEGEGSEVLEAWQEEHVGALRTLFEELQTQPAAIAPGLFVEDGEMTARLDKVLTLVSQMAKPRRGSLVLGAEVETRMRKLADQINLEITRFGAWMEEAHDKA